jgi:hypothetical protein
MELDSWTGLACLVADPACSEFRRFGDNGKGAYVNVVAWAKSEEDFEERVEHRVAGLDCILLELDDVQPLDCRMSEDDCPEELITMRSTANRQREDIVFGTFHIWTQNHAN